jgi:hypothetical protein
LLILSFCFLGLAPGLTRKLTKSEIDHYVAIVEKLPRCRTMKRSFHAFGSGLRRDHGKAVYMLFYLVRYFPELRRFPGRSRVQRNTSGIQPHYERRLTRLWLSHAVHPTLDDLPNPGGLITIQAE